MRALSSLIRWLLARVASLPPVMILLAVLEPGKVPLRYNFRNLFVRWKTTLLTAVGFTLVVALLVVMLAFIEGLNELSRNSGRPGNVIILRDGANDELFSDIAIDDKVYELWSNHPEVVKDAVGRPLASQEIYSLATQELPRAESDGRPRYRFLQIRGVEQPEMAAAVHDLSLRAGSWFGRTGNECVMGEGIAQSLGFKVRDTFEPRPGLVWTLVGVLASSGSPFDSEIWSKREEVGRYFGKDNEERKQSFYSSIVVTTPDYATAQWLARDLQNRTQVRIRAVPEKDHYEELSKSNQMFLGAAIFIAIVMAAGGMFGLMNTMFAAVSQRIKDLGVLRVLGYSSRQILLSFLIESLLVAVVGGVAGLLIGAAFDGVQQTGQISSGQGGGKTVVFQMIVNRQVLNTGAAFTLVMGFLGGSLPAWSAMRMKVLDALRS